MKSFFKDLKGLWNVELLFLKKHWIGWLISIAVIESIPWVVFRFGMTKEERAFNKARRKILKEIKKKARAAEKKS